MQAPVDDRRSCRLRWHAERIGASMQSPAYPPLCPGLRMKRRERRCLVMGLDLQVCYDH